MECPNCSFQNTPGMTTCVRCQSRLDFSDVYFLPPRARGSVKVRHVRRRLGASSFRLRERCSAATQWLDDQLHPDVDWPAVLWSIVPGLGHLRLGHRTVGLVALAAWLSLLVLAGANIATGRGWLFAILAIGLHCFVVSLLLAPALSQLPVRQRMLIGFVTYLALIATLYGPVTLVSRTCFRLIPIDGVRTTATLANGDIILCSGTWTTPRSFHPGDLVVYEIRGLNSQGVMIEPGLGLDRIVGLPGDRVTSDGHVLTVNGVALPPDRLPIGGLSSLPILDFVVGAGEYAILPSALNWRAHGPPQNVQRLTDRMIASTSRVREEDLLGRAWWRLRPWGRFGPLPGATHVE